MSKAPGSESNRAKLLVVDDEEIILNIATDVLESEGYEVRTETNPLNALKAVTQEKFDFVLTDINMPQMSGLEMIKKILEIDSEIGAIFMTGYANLETAKEAIKTGAYDYIMKPFELSELRAAVTKAVEKRRELVAKSDAGRLDRLSDLVEVLYTVGDKTSLLKLSLGLALINSGLTTGVISCWEKKSSELVLIWTDNVRQSDFKELSIQLDDALAAECFDFEAPLKLKGLNDHPLMTKLVKSSPEVNTAVKYFNPEYGNTSLKVFHRDQFFVMICVQDKSPEEPISEGDLKLLNIVLNMAMVVVDNILLLGESQNALNELEKLHDQIVNLERVATQGIMSAEIGHELNNYLNIVRSNFELLQLKAKITNPDDIGKYMRGIEESLGQMTRFTSGLADAATLKSEKTEVDLNALIDDIISFLSPQRKFREIKLQHVQKSEVPQLVADTRQLQQLFYNTLNNAAESFATVERDEREITISTGFSEGAVSIEVSDNGSGIPQELLTKTFQNRFTTKSNGHGFGLIVCKKVVENHDGTIVIDSAEGEGTTFRIKIPLSSPQNPVSQDV
ncbi:MAG: response regulator [candidate division Zixibacteria bacterium]|nr:response regulator [candidate division Zixibacteria bacterium]MBU1471074.1 response regulator [candidate division Zixibacteria bacterium]MBU2625446.1 response regulator [candidate division Zixibacteria bacterium]